MARWHLTATTTHHKTACDVCTTAEFQPNGSHVGEGHFVQSYKKRAIDNTNFLNFDNGDWICSAGTILAEGELGKEPLERVYSEYISGGINRARSKVLGHYAVAIKHENRITVFTDPQGAFRLFYTEKENYVISNSFHVVGSCLSNFSIDKVRLIADALQIALPGEETPIQGVKRLFGTQKLTISLPTGTPIVEEVNGQIDTINANQSSIRQAVEQVSKETKEVFDQISKVVSVGVNATGGLDTRTVLAGALNQGIDPLLMHGVGNSALTNTQQEDQKISRELADRFNLNYYEMDWSDNHPHDYDTLDELFERHGFNFRGYGAPRPFYKELEGGITPYPKLHLGGYAHAFTNKKPWGYKKNKFPFQYLFENITHDYIESEEFGCSSEYREKMRKDIRSAIDCSPYSYPEHNANLKEFINSRLFIKSRTSANNINLFSEFSHYLAPFLLKKLSRPLINLPSEFRTDDEFQIRLINDLWPDALDVQVYSGLERVNVDEGSYSSRRPPTVKLKNTAIERIKPILPAEIKPMANQIYRRVLGNSTDSTDINKEIRKKNSEYISKNEFLDCIDSVHGLNLVRVNNIQRNAFGISKMMPDRHNK